MHSVCSTQSQHKPLIASHSTSEPARILANSNLSARWQVYCFDLFEALAQRLSLHGGWVALLSTAEWLQLEQLLQTGALHLGIKGPFVSNHVSGVNAEPNASSAMELLPCRYAVADAPQLPVVQYGSCKSYGCTRCAVSSVFL